MDTKDKVKHPFLLMTLITIALILAFWGAYRMLGEHKRTFNRLERAIIEQSDSLMYVTEIGRDSAVLRTPSTDLARWELKSQTLKDLIAKMMYTVQDPSQGGVGIAAPQVGVGKRIIVVQRLDKEGEPYECYINIHINRFTGDLIRLPEGCLSVPPYRGIVPRFDSVSVSYLRPGGKEVVTEKIGGYTARIFQHEVDHLEGILYTDRADSVFVSESWAKEREEYSYTRPAWWPL